MAITKTMGHNEQLVIDMPSWNPVTGKEVHSTVEEIHELLNEAVKFADVRAFELNTRMLEGYELQSYCTPAEWTKILDMLEVVSGRQQLDTVVRRWQSAIEETAELEIARQQQYHTVPNHPWTPQCMEYCKEKDQAILAEAEKFGNIYDGKEY